MIRELICFTLLLATARCLAQGTFNVTFDGAPFPPPQSSHSVTNYSEAGISFTPIPSTHDFSRVGVGYPIDPQNGTADLRSGLGQSVTFSFINGSVLNLISVDLAEYSTAVPDPVTVQFVGYYADGSTTTTSFTTDGIIDGTGPLADFQTFYFNQDWSGLTRVEIPTSGWSLDNLVVSIPEPGTSALLALGALTFSFWRNRRRKYES